MSKLEIDYDELVQKALRGVVKEILEKTARDGLPGDHHFYVAFRTRAPGVQMADHLRARYPDEMTIVLQHKFWGLKVFDDHFQVGLSFQQNPEHLVIPFAAIVGFVDPSVQFALQFQDHEADQDAETADTAADDTSGAPAEMVDISARARGREDQAERRHASTGATADKRPNDDADEPADGHAAAAAPDAEAGATRDKDPDGDAEGDDTNVVALDAFRKKT
ncbi:hypothetical protein EV659_102339 [Rhodothalassium salexigens DSM 2132]|uniref:Stringent starvation protein B n=1 Tax=Rhodothalassium salexigens DSM 2132 TaxID=1188247 RepID=A0A4R2PQ58_RHOSA|nr:ClpXP protease specificity-enhancing factor SspB [Rhodothalassium salexigens]MBB4210514.1 hypothetical protein [Rhodothalassium salexigens DSM 2132]MBK1638075.1 hypothetical protein [Rhodothalassium salexigens DSM 2132]TCP37929.1 hypothetical protein EV659_102339 [Rhodothalassium salexigens DSM 2132]